MPIERIATLRAFAAVDRLRRRLYPTDFLGE